MKRPLLRAAAGSGCRAVAGGNRRLGLPESLQLGVEAAGSEVARITWRGDDEKGGVIASGTDVVPVATMGGTGSSKLTLAK